MPLRGLSDVCCTWCTPSASVLTILEGQDWLSTFPQQCRTQPLHWCILTELRGTMCSTMWHRSYIYGLLRPGPQQCAPLVVCAANASCLFRGYTVWLLCSKHLFGAGSHQTCFCCCRHLCCSSCLCRHPMSGSSFSSRCKSQSQLHSHGQQPCSGVPALLLHRVIFVTGRVDQQVLQVLTGLQGTCTTLC